MVKSLRLNVSLMNIKEQVAFNLFMKHETINDNNFIRSRKTWDKYKNSPSLQHYWDEAGTIIPMIRAECQREIARHLIKSSLWREIPTPTYSGDKNSTGGIVQLSDTYYLISENIIKQLESGTFEEGK